jgi:hypothetical protein
MFEKTSRLAERLATSVSRRRFLGSAGRWAGATALALGGVLTTAGSARADNTKSCCYCCDSISDFCTFTECVGRNQTCPPCPPGTYPFTRAVAQCDSCVREGCHKPCGGA